MRKTVLFVLLAVATGAALGARVRAMVQSATVHRPVSPRGAGQSRQQTSEAEPPAVAMSRRFEAELR
jgi:hypothetical protein